MLALTLGVTLLIAIGVGRVAARHLGVSAPVVLVGLRSLSSLVPARVGSASSIGRHVGVEEQACGYTTRSVVRDPDAANRPLADEPDRVSQDLVRW